MTRLKTKDKIGATPRKLALIAVLGILQAIVIVRQLPESKSTEDRSPRKRRARSVATKKTKTTERNVAKQVKPPTNPWPDYSLEQTIARNPLAIPRWVQTKPKVINQQPANVESLGELQQQGTSIVVIAGDDKRATIGEAQIQVGDIIDGYRVTDINTRGVVLQQLAPK